VGNGPGKNRGSQPINAVSLTNVALRNMRGKKYLGIAKSTHNKGLILLAVFPPNRSGGSLIEASNLSHHSFSIRIKKELYCSFPIPSAPLY
jgi:hypothetical protein